MLRFLLLLRLRYIGAGFGVSPPLRFEIRTNIIVRNGGKQSLHEENNNSLACVYVCVRVCVCVSSIPTSSAHIALVTRDRVAV